MTIDVALVISRVTGSAVGLIRWTGPSHDRAISPVTVGAIEIDAMVSGIGSTSVIKPAGIPILCSMACVTGERGGEVARGRSGCGHSIVA